MELMIRRYGLTLLVLFVSAFLAVAVKAQPIRGVDVVPAEEKRSSIHEVDGYAYLSENMTVAQLRQAALATAKREALEMAQTYIKSKTLVQDFEVTYDLVWSNAEGSVSVLEQKDLGVVENSRYHVWIKAEVRYELKPKATTVSAEAAAMDPRLPLKVQVWTDKPIYHEGENVSVMIRGNRNFYGRVVDINSEGQIVQLLPNAYRTNNYFKGGETYRIPDMEDKFRLAVTAPFGYDKIVVYASEAPQGEVFLQTLSNGLGFYRGLKDNLDTATRGLAVVAGEHGDSSGAEFYEAIYTFRTEK